MELQKKKKKKEKLSSAVGSVNKTCEVETQRTYYLPSPKFIAETRNRYRACETGLGA